MIKVAALTSGKNVPSTRFRVRQHIEPLRKAGINVREYIPIIDKYAHPPILSGCRPIRLIWKGVKIITRAPGLIGSWKAGVTWLEREMHPGCLTFEPFLKRPYVFDVDDAIWLTPPFGRRASISIARNAECVLAGNSYIAEWFGSYAKDVRIVHTAVDTHRIKPRNHRRSESTGRAFTIGWTGTSSNYTYLYEIEGPLEQFLKTHNAKFLVMADEPPKFRRLHPNQVRYIKWSPEIEVEVLAQMDVGLMPLPSTEWSMGKCSFKMLQYMASGVPVVVSPIGMNADVLSMGQVGFPAESHADWYEALVSFFKDPFLSYKCGETGRLIVERYFSRTVVLNTLIGIFKEFA